MSNNNNSTSTNSDVTVIALCIRMKCLLNLNDWESAKDDAETFAQTLKDGFVYAMESGAFDIAALMYMAPWYSVEYKEYHLGVRKMRITDTLQTHLLLDDDSMRSSYCLESVDHNQNTNFAENCDGA
eukprot:gene5708-11518_t